MVTSITTRMGITRWSADADPLTRAQLTGDHESLELKALGYLQGTSRPAASAALTGFLYADTATSPPVMSYCDGDEWVTFGGDDDFGSAVGLTVGGPNVDGSAATVSRTDHEHSLPGWGTVANLDGVSRDGVATTFSRSDHTHEFDPDSIDIRALGPNSITAYNIAPDAVQSVHIQTGAVGQSEIAQDAVTSTKIQSDAVGNAELQTDAVTASKINTNAVGASEIAAGAVGASEIATNAVGNSELDTNAVGSAQLAANAVTSAKILDGSVTVNKLANNSVTAVKIAANAVGASEIAASAVTAAKIATGAVTDVKIQSGINANQVTSGTLDDANLPSTWDVWGPGTFVKPLEVGGRATVKNPTVPGILEVIFNNTSQPSHAGITLLYDDPAIQLDWMKFEFAPGDGGGVRGSGSAGSLGLVQPSDIRTKTDVEDFRGAVETINALEVIKYERHGSERVGFSAQQVKEMPELERLVHISASEGFDDFHSLTESELVPYLVAALKELKDELAKLKASR